MNAKQVEKIIKHLMVHSQLKVEFKYMCILKSSRSSH